MHVIRSQLRAITARDRSPGRVLQPIVCGAITAAMLTGSCGPTDLPDGSEDLPAGEMPERWESGAAVDADRSGDLRAEALALIAAREAGQPDPDPPIAFAWHPPATIRVWRRGLDHSSTSCSGRVDVIALESYVKGVLPHEWIRSWHAESLRAGAIAIRTYAANWIMQGGKYSCADLDDTTASQVYKDERFPETNAAVDATAAAYVMKTGLPVFAEYSAENGNPTATGISDSVCTGHPRFGHGRGTCQWGSQRWATQGKTHAWILEHYYPGAAVVDTDDPGTDPGDEIVVDSDNARNDTAIARIDFTGTWTSSTAAAGYYGSDYRWAATEATSAPATFWFYLPAAATRTVDAWWTAGTNRSATATFIAYDAAGADLGRVAKDQRAAGGQWNQLGTFAFGAGWNRIVLSRWQAAGSVVIADAIRVR